MLQRTTPLLSTSLRQIARTLAASGVEIFDQRDGELQIAERVRMHLMDSGVRIRAKDSRIEIVFTATASKAEHPSADPDDLFEMIRKTVGVAASAHGYREVGSSTTEARDPQCRDRVLDVFHGIEYARALDERAHLADEVRWALELDKSLAAS
jgi:hypothetical protein